MRYRIMGELTGRSAKSFVVTAETVEDARRIAERDGIRVEGVAPIDEAAESGERWFVGATASVLMIEGVIAIFALAATVAGPVVQQAVSAVRWVSLDEPLFRSVTGAAAAGAAGVVLLVAPTLLLAQGTYGGSRLARRLDLIWAGVQALLSLAVAVLLAVGVAEAVGRRESALLFGVPMVVALLRLTAYLFLGGVLLRSQKARAFLDDQATRRVQVVTPTSVTLAVLIVLALLTLATVPLWG